MDNMNSLASSSEKWGYSFLGVTFGVSSVLVAPLVFSLVKKEKLYSNLPWLACFGCGVILALVFNHNIVDVVETTSFNWKIGSVFLAGIITNYIGIYGFTTDDHCCELESDCPDESSVHNNKCCEEKSDILEEAPRSGERKEIIHIPNKHSTKHWVIPILVGDAFCNFSDGILISSAFILCGHSLGWLTTLAVVLHEITHEIGDFSIILSNGMDFRKAVFVNLLSASSSYIGWIIVNSLSYLENSHIIAAYLVTYGSGVLVSLVLTILPKYIKHTSLKVQRLRIFTIILGSIVSTLLFAFTMHCE